MLNWLIRVGFVVLNFDMWLVCCMSWLFVLLVMCLCVGVFFLFVLLFCFELC